MAGLVSDDKREVYKESLIEFVNSCHVDPAFLRRRPTFERSVIVRAFYNLKDTL
jgi:hypothetical protein